MGAGRARVEAAAGGWEEEAEGGGEGQRHWLVGVKGEGYEVGQWRVGGG